MFEFNKIRFVDKCNAFFSLLRMIVSKTQRATLILVQNHHKIFGILRK